MSSEKPRIAYYVYEMYLSYSKITQMEYYFTQILKMNINFSYPVSLAVNHDDFPEKVTIKVPSGLRIAFEKEFDNVK